MLLNPKPEDQTSADSGTTRLREPKVPARLAREIANRALRDAYRHGLLASDLVRAIHELAPETKSGR